MAPNGLPIPGTTVSALRRHDLANWCVQFTLRATASAPYISRYEPCCQAIRGKSNGGDLCRSAAHDPREPEPLGAVLSSIANDGHRTGDQEPS